MSYNDLKNLFSGLREDFINEGLDDFMAMDIASDMIRTDSQLRNAISKHFPGVTDQVGFLADQIVG